MNAAAKTMFALFLASGSMLGQTIDGDNDGLPDAWEAAHGLAAANPADALIDNDGDGMLNLLEYALGGDPRVNDPATRPRAEFTDAFAISFNRRMDPQFSIVAERTDSLSPPAWSTNGLFLSARQEIGLDLERVTYRVTPSVPEPRAQFFRVAVRR